LNSGGVDGDGSDDGEDEHGKTDGEKRTWRTRQAATEIRSGDMRVRRRARSGTSHRLDSRAWLFHALHNTRIGSVTTSAEVVR
jgi:hypothetical protein